VTAALEVRIVALALGRVKVLRVVAGPVKAMKPLFVPPLAPGITPVSVMLPRALRATLPLALTATVPDALGRVIVLSAVGLTSVMSVSLASALLPSKIIPVLAKVVWLTPRVLEARVLA
jgi:hypothetical protein